MTVEFVELRGTMCSTPFTLRAAMVARNEKLTVELWNTKYIAI